MNSKQALPWVPTLYLAAVLCKTTDCLIASRRQQGEKARIMLSKRRNGVWFSVNVSMVTVITAYIYRPSISKELKALYRHRQGEG